MPTKVLVFESDAAFAGELRNELSRLGCTTTVVDDGNLGLQHAATDRPDLILLSIELPRMNGFSVCNKLKKDPNLKAVPLIIMSSESSDETFEQHKKLRTRAEDYVHKPVAFGELLEHIRAFVTLSVAPDFNGEAGIVIEDEIEVGATDYMLDDDEESQTMIVSAAEVSEVLEPTPSQADTVDADVDAIAESAFGRLTEPEPHPTVGTETSRSLKNGFISPEAVVAAPLRASISPAPPRASVAPPASSRSSVPPAVRSVRPPPFAGVDAGEHDRVREELARTKERLGANDRELEEAHQEIEKLRIEAREAERLAREIEELKARLAAGAKPAGVSSREFLDLREALNKKDKEILSLKESLSRKDKEIVESQDRALGFERAKSDLDERLLALEREVADTREKSEALSTDKELAKKASEDFRTRLEKVRTESEAKDRQINDLRTKFAEERAANEIKLDSVRAELDQVLANERAEQARKLDEAEARRRKDVAAAERERDLANSASREQAQRDKAQALDEQGEQLRREHEAARAALGKGHQEELDRTRAEGARAVRDVEERLAAELSAANKRAEEQVADVRAQSERREQEVLEKLRADQAERVAAVENDRDARVAALEAKTGREIGEANDKLAKLDMDASALRGELQSLREEKASGDATAAATIAELDKHFSELKLTHEDTTAKLATASERLASIEAELATVRDEFARAKDKLESESLRASKAVSKWEADKQSLERAKDALAVVLAQIEETESRTL